MCAKLWVSNNGNSAYVFKILLVCLLWVEGKFNIQQLVYALCNICSREQNAKFAEVLVQLESNPVCQSLSLHSFLMLPMQRITRLPLLIDAVLTRLDQTDDEYSTCQLALATLNKVSVQ